MRSIHNSLMRLASFSVICRAHLDVQSQDHHKPWKAAWVGGAIRCIRQVVAVIRGALSNQLCGNVGQGSPVLQQNVLGDARCCWGAVYDFQPSQVGLIAQHNKPPERRISLVDDCL